ncbi:MAG: inorganic phosphate transporter [Bdellovibrionota bacterium]
MGFTLLVVVIIVTLIFEYINGMHDAANAIATVVSTKALSPRKAVAYGAMMNVFGAFAGTHVAKTIGAGIIDITIVTQMMILSALLGAIIWNMLTWYFGIPSSSSHALIGGLMGAAWSKAGVGAIHVLGTFEKIIGPMLTSPALGFFVGMVFMIGLYWIAYRQVPVRIHRVFRKCQLVSAGFLAFAHGSNDAQKTMGIITLALFTYGAIPTVDVPVWVIVICALCMGAGSMAGGWRIIQTLGNKIIKLEPIQGFAAESSASGIILAASHFGIPISTTHVITTSIMGVGSTKGASAVKWGLVGRIVQAWVLTIPTCMLLAAGIYKFMSWLVEVA